MISTFPVSKAGQLLARIRKSCRVPDQLPGGWSISPTDPNKLLAACPGLHLHPGLTLIAYLYTAGGNGNGVVYAYPEDKPIPPPAACRPDKNHWLDAPKPTEASEPMTGIVGEGSPWSYLQATFLGRELVEFGARWHGCHWSTHELYADDTPTALDWIQSRPDSFDPQVVVDSAGVTVTFYTHSALGQEAVYRHTDTYTAHGYQFHTTTDVVATGGPGYMF